MFAAFMVSDIQVLRRRAMQMLVVATLFWGLSFPVMKALALMQQDVLSGASSWFISANAITVRFAAATMLMILWYRKALLTMTWLEFWQGLGLGLFGGLGLLFQMDGLMYTSASTSAFLTQCYCLFLPLWAAIRFRRRPSLRIISAALLVMAGIAILARVDWQSLRLGRGEWETLIGSILFTGQILWLERPIFSKNRLGHFTTVMFAATALILLPMAILTARQTADWVLAYRSWPAVGFMVVLVLACTLISYTLMNQWQSRISATEAGLIYSAEPVFASLFALFLPAWFSAWAGTAYSNEQLTWNLLAGGGFILAANLLVQAPMGSWLFRPRAAVMPVVISESAGKKS